ncbi:MAG TPA: hypothetical protein DDY13_18065 [Cytophagales bacterium]|nr:hypothetical protein [Cytophagales bacterium]
MALGLSIVGVHQSLLYGFQNSYWIFMFSLSLVFLYGFLKNKLQNQENSARKSAGKQKKNKSTRRKK